MSVVGRLALVTTLLCLAACGAAESTPTCRPLATPAAPVAGDGALTATSSSGSVAPGDTVHFAVTVRGPLTFLTDCAMPLQVTIIDSSGVSVDTTTSTTAVPAPQCGTVTVAAGAEAVYQTAWTPDATLPSGVYTVTLLLGDRAPLHLALPVRTSDGGC